MLGKTNPSQSESGNKYLPVRLFFPHFFTRHFIIPVTVTQFSGSDKRNETLL